MLKPAWPKPTGDYVVTLITMASGAKGTVQQIDADIAQTQRLHALGIYCGASIEKLHETTPAGPIVVCTPQRCNIAIGRELAKLINV